METPTHTAPSVDLDRLVRQLREAEERIEELKRDREILHQDGERWREYGRSAIALRIKSVDTLEEVDDQLSQIENTVHGMHMDAITKLRKFVAESLLSLQPNSVLSQPHRE